MQLPLQVMDVTALVPTENELIEEISIIDAQELEPVEEVIEVVYDEKKN